ncbi:MAG: hypothetical protein U9R23_02620 [Candidatus Cloacimonadota bacterium]|nr:hypothetical protein [Candidatus Cloacimonadota bacterium]
MLLAFLPLFCCSPKNNRSPIDELQFNVDRTLIEEPYTESTIGISFCPPLHWKPVSAKILAQIESIQKEATPDSSDDFQLTPSQVFVDTNDNAFCFLSQLGANDTQNLDEIANRYKKALKKKYSNGDFKEGIFRLKGFFINQFIITENGLVILKLLISSPSTTPFLLDYIIPLSVYEKNLKAIESSIGSIEKLKN